MYSSTNSILKKLLIHQIIKETDEAVSLILLPLDGWQPIYKAGQFITLYFETDYGEKRRSYSISSSSAMNEPLRITIKKIDNGEFSRQLVYQAKAGDFLQSTGISGFFILPKNVDEFDSICFLVAGSGITPCMALIKEILAIQHQRIVLFYSNRSENDTIFLKELEVMQQQNHNRFIIKFLFSNRNNVMESRMSHWLLSQLLQQYLMLHTKSLFFICGPYSYMQTVSISLLSNGIRQTQIIKEDFNPLPKLIIPTPPDTDVHEVTIFINNTIYTFNVQYPLSISSAAKQKGIILPYSCEAGRCGSCAATCTKGKIWMAYNEVLVDEEVTNGRILCCQAFPVGGNATIQF
ncbi:MAG TPA: iron-sulfur cluster-binding domain-containing protein [Ferruginibacter sp.]|nr:iron-sulfur cluster-binding domain-containing protein [Ferruginibacter sp.]